MSPARVLLLPIVLPLAGCAASPAADLIAGPEKLAVQDDAYCKSIGLRFGTNEYAACRMTQTADRNARLQHALDTAASINITPTFTQQPTINCHTTRGVQGSTDTVCQRCVYCS
jgi:hypothetical protein